MYAFNETIMSAIKDGNFHARAVLKQFSQGTTYKWQTLPPW